MLIAKDSINLSLARQLLVGIIVQIQLQLSFSVTQLLPIQVPNSSFYMLNQHLNQNTELAESSNSNYDMNPGPGPGSSTGQGDYYNGLQSPSRGGKLYLKSDNIGNSNPGSILNTISNYGSKFWPSSEDSSGSASNYGSDSPHSDASVTEDESTSYGTGPAGAASGILGSGSSYSLADTFGQSHGHDHRSYNYGHGHGHGSGHHSSPKTYQYQIYPGNTKGWGSHGHGHQKVKLLHGTGNGWGGWTTGWNGWSSQGTGWDSDVGFGHELFEKLEGWLGIKTSGDKILTVLKSLLISVPVAIIVILLILVLPIPVITFPNPCLPRQLGSESPTSGFSLGRSRLWKETARLTELVVNSDSCVERISCEIGKMARKYNKQYIIDTLKGFLPVNSKYTERISRSLQDEEETYLLKDNFKVDADGQIPLKNACKRFTCDPVGRVKKEFSRIWNSNLFRGSKRSDAEVKSNIKSSKAAQ